jgi:hypothetical protein
MAGIHQIADQFCAHDLRGLSRAEDLTNNLLRE